MCQERRRPSVFKSVKKLVTTLAIGSLLVLPATALAGNGGHHSVPPGNSGLDQYTENIPGLAATIPRAAAVLIILVVEVAGAVRPSARA